MKRSPLKRKKSLRQYHEDKIKRDAPRNAQGIVDRKFGRRTPLKKIAKSTRRRMTEYLAASRLWLLDHPWCEICIARWHGGEEIRVNPATEVHHKFGRIGRLLNWQPGWIASCRQDREWAHANTRRARELGILCEPAEWNVFPAMGK